jgi:hypothetical protein
MAIMRLKFRKQASKIKLEIVHFNIDFWQELGKTVKLATIVFLLVGSWGTTEIAQAETARIDNITVERQPDETYESLIGRAEAAARSAVQQGFDQGNRVTDVSVVVLGQNQGTITPVLTVELSRPQWNSSDVQNGITYFGSARSLLGLEEQQLANTNTNPNQPSSAETPPTPPEGQQNNSNAPGSSRELINNTPIQPITPPTPPGATPAPSPIPGGPALTPNPQQPSNTPETSPGNTSTPSNTPETSPGDTSTPNSTQQNNTAPSVNNATPPTTSPNSVNESNPQLTPPPVNDTTPQITGPTPVNPPGLPQGTPSNSTNSDTPTSP